MSSAEPKREIGIRFGLALLRQTDLAHEFSKPRIGTQRAELGVRVQSNEKPIVFLIGSIKPMEGLRFVPQSGIQFGNFKRREVARLPLCLAKRNGFGERAFPA